MTMGWLNLLPPPPLPNVVLAFGMGRYAAIADVARSMEEERVEAKLRTKRRATITDAFATVVARSSSVARGMSSAVRGLRSQLSVRLGKGGGGDSGAATARGSGGSVDSANTGPYVHSADGAVGVAHEQPPAASGNAALAPHSAHFKRHREAFPASAVANPMHRALAASAALAGAPSAGSISCSCS